MKTRLNGTQRNAMKFVSYLKDMGRSGFWLFWSASNHPTAKWQDTRIGYAGGAGYHKRGYVLAQALLGLVPDLPSAGQRGEKAVVDVLARHGWLLEGFDARRPKTDAPWVEFYMIRRCDR